MFNYNKFLDNKLYCEDLEHIADNFNNIYTNNNIRILLTGATGLIGSCIVDSIIYFNRKSSNKDKIKLVCMGRSYEKFSNRFPYIETDDNIQFIKQDLCENLNIPQEYNFNYIIHGGSNSDPLNFSKFPVETINANVMGTNNLLAYCEKNKARFIYLSSREAYGFIDGKEAYEEEDYGILNFNEIRACYPEGKRVSEILCRSYGTEYGVDFSIARLGYIYGPTMQENDSKVIAQFIRKALAYDDIVMKSTGEQIRSYTYVTDAVDGIFKILFCGAAGECYNVANMEANISIKDIAEMLSNIQGINIRYEMNDNLKNAYSNPQNALLEDKKLRNLGYKPIYTVENGIKRTLEICSRKE